MKSFIVLVIFCLLSHTFAGQLEEDFDAAEKECLAEKQLSKNDILGMKDLEKPTPNMTIFAGCFLEKVGFTKDGAMQDNVILEKAKDSVYPKYFKNCVRVCHHIKGSDQDDTAYKMILCFRKVDKFEFLKEWKNICKDCKKEVKPSTEEYTKLQNLPVDNPTANMKQYAACVFENEGFLKDNVLQENVILEVAGDYNDAEYLKTFVEKCKVVIGKSISIMVDIRLLLSKNDYFVVDSSPPILC